MAESKTNNLDAIAPDSTAIDRYESEQPSAVSIRSLDDIKRISTIFIGSGMFKGDRGLSQEQQLYQAGVKIIAGVEFGIQPFAAMRGINIINGNAEMSANLMAAKVKKHPKYDYRVTKLDGDGCVIEFFEILHPGDAKDKWDKLGESSFTAEDARKAGLTGQNWQKFPRNMYFARAMSNGVRIFTPDVFYGAPVYVESEIGGSLDTSPETASHEPADAEIVDAAAPDVDQIGTPIPEQTREDRKAAVQQIEAELAAEESQPVTQWDAHEVAKLATPDPAPDTRKLDPKKTQRIYKLGRQLGYDQDDRWAKLQARVGQLANNQEADEAIAILEEELAKNEDNKTPNKGRG